ncbi:hypothetical protein MNBD_IGNAVI01-3049 [hydrothermal vent metagenome]|uniref:Uncharacterized protein n=1 Tax=hydrothermal vent metagenome TaxID=652676 RepID=A0A3B1CBJ4_9ZZZZ
MKLIKVLFIITVLMSFSSIHSQETENYKIIAGVRLNPLIVYNLEGGREEFFRLHAEIGALLKKRTYISVGYTPFMNSVYSFNEYWFIPFDKPLPISAVISAEYMIDNNKLILQGGPNIKLMGGNVFAFIFTPADNINWGLKVGAFIPINFVVSKG